MTIVGGDAMRHPVVPVGTAATRRAPYRRIRERGNDHWRLVSAQNSDGEDRFGE